MKRGENERRRDVVFTDLTNFETLWLVYKSVRYAHVHVLQTDELRPLSAKAWDRPKILQVQ